MKKKRAWEEVSAYLDNEADDPAAVARLLQRDADAATRHMAMAKLATHMNAMKVPEVDPAFATRVVAQVRAEREARSARWRRLRVPVFAATVAALAVATAGLYALATREQELPTNRWAEVDPDAIMVVLEEKLAENPEALEPSWVYETASYPETDALADPWVDVLAGEDWFVAFADAYDSNEDLDTLLFSLDETETETFKGLLVSYAQGGSIS